MSRRSAAVLAVVLLAACQDATAPRPTGSGVARAARTDGGAYRDRTMERIQFTEDVAPCVDSDLDEFVRISGTAQITQMVVATSSGRFRIRYAVTLQNASGVGVTSGERFRYVANSVDTFVGEYDVATGSWGEYAMTTVFASTLAGRGRAINVVNVVTGRFVYDAAGNLVSSRYEYRVKPDGCAG
jgi:hypothetical protein